MESSAWIETIDDGVLYFKNVTLQVKEISEKSKKPALYEHTEANCVINLSAAAPKYEVSKKYLHSELNKFVTIDELEHGDEDKITKCVITVDGDKDSITLTPDQVNLLLTNVNVYVRLLSKSGIKYTVKGQVNINDNLLKCIREAVEIAGLQPGKFKYLSTEEVKDNKLEITKDTSVSSLYVPNEGITVFACEGLGKPSKWKRFSTHYEGSTWSNSGSYSDGLVFVPKQAISLAGFSTWAAKDEPSYFMKFKVEIDGRVVIEDQNPTKYDKFEDTYYNRVYFETPFDVSANQKIKMTCWISKDFASNSYIYTYYGTNGSDYAQVQNEHMGLFELEGSDNSSNGTSTYSGHFPEIFYYL